MVKIRRVPEINNNNMNNNKQDFDDIGSDSESETKKSVLSKCKKLTKWVEMTPEDDCHCPICLNTFDETRKGYQLSECKHIFHKHCLAKCYKGFIICPSCGLIYGTRKGTQPPGTMQISKLPPGKAPLSGYENIGTIKINYAFSNGIQSQKHPNPGKHFSGTRRTAYLPDNKEGNDLLKLFKIAFDRKLIFRIGTSVTTGEENTVVWNGIHMKTSLSGGPTNFGYPDDTYFDRVKEELKDFGVTDE